MYRQGDVLIRKIEELPANLKNHKLDNGRIVLAYGEVTGHAHAITKTNKVKSFVDGDGKLYLDISKSVDLEHEEHDTITLPRGIYEVIRQREYSPEQIRNVAD